MDKDSAKAKKGRLPIGKINDVLDSASMGVWQIRLIDGCKPRLIVSEAMLRLLGQEDSGMEDEEELYEAWASRICPDSQAAITKYLDEIKAKGRSEVVYKWNHPKLGVRYIRCGGISYRESEEVLVLEGYHYDITHQFVQNIQDRLVVTALADLYIGVFYIDINENSYTAYLNNIPTIERLLPKSGKLSEAVDVLVGERSKYLYPDKYKDTVREFLDFATLNKRMKYKNRISTVIQGNMIGWARVDISVSDRNSDGTIHHVVLTEMDITEQKRLEQERLEELRTSISENLSKTEMLRNMTHEIRTPLNAMFGFSQLLGMPEGAVSDEQKAEYLSHIYNSFNMLTMLIDDVLDIADAEHGNYRVEHTLFAVNEVCRNALQMSEMRCQAGVKIYFTSEVPDDYTIVSDNRRIEQVLVNYLINSCKHTKEGEIHLHLSTTENPGRLTFSVTDTGDGVPEDMRADIFQRYKKANSTVKGSGLGLNICSIIAEKLGAEVKLDTTYTNGARFLFIL